MFRVAELHELFDLRVGLRMQFVRWLHGIGRGQLHRNAEHDDLRSMRVRLRL